MPRCFDAAWHPDALAVVDLTERGMGTTNSKMGTVSYRMVKLGMQFLAHWLLPGWVPKPVLSTLSETTRRCVRYSVRTVHTCVAPPYTAE